jgi:uncharacterized membrane protein YeaQ/YmgE (transglycosylase-associated protein family)
MSMDIVKGTFQNFVQLVLKDMWSCPIGRLAVGLHCDVLSIPEELSMNLIIWLVVGGLIGWVASKIMNTDAQQGIFLNIVVGIVGSMLGGWLVAPLLGSATVNQNDFSIMGLLSSLIGAVILLAIVNFFRRGKVR